MAYNIILARTEKRHIQKFILINIGEVKLADIKNVGIPADKQLEQMETDQTKKDANQPVGDI